MMTSFRVTAAATPSSYQDELRRIEERAAEDPPVSPWTRAYHLVGTLDFDALADELAIEHGGSVPPGSCPRLLIRKAITLGLQAHVFDVAFGSGENAKNARLEANVWTDACYFISVKSSSRGLEEVQAVIARETAALIEAFDEGR